VSALTDLLVVFAASATIASLAYPPLARVEWGVAAAAIAAWALASVGAAGGVLLAGVVVATVVERGGRPRTAGFNNLVARVGAAVGAAALAGLIGVRVFLVDVQESRQVLIVLAVGIAAILYILARDGAVEESRAGRLALVAAAAGWLVAGSTGTSSVAVAVGAAGLAVAMALAPRAMAQAR
jgi:hypothetical protein